MFSLQHSLVPTFLQRSCAPRLFRPAQGNSLEFLSKHLREKIREEIAKTVQFAVRTVRDQFTKAERSWSSNFKLLILFFLTLPNCHKPRAISFCVLLGYFRCANKNVKIYCLDISFTEPNLTEKIKKKLKSLRCLLENNNSLVENCRLQSNSFSTLNLKSLTCCCCRWRGVRKSCRGE